MKDRQWRVLVLFVSCRLHDHECHIRKLEDLNRDQ